MRLPHIPESDVVLSTSSAPTNFSGAVLFLAILTGLKAPSTVSTFDDGNSNNAHFEEDSSPSLTRPYDDDDGHQHRPKRSTALSPASDSPENITLRLNTQHSDYKNLHIQDGSIDIGADSQCMRRHKFDVPMEGSFYIIESIQGGHFLRVGTNGELQIQSGRSSDVTSVSTTNDPRFFRIRMLNHGDRYYVIQHVRTGRYLRHDNSTRPSISTITEEELQDETVSVEFEMFPCNI